MVQCVLTRLKSHILILFGTEGFCVIPGNTRLTPNDLSSRFISVSYFCISSFFSFIPAVKLPGREADHSSATSAEVKKNIHLYINSPIRLHGGMLN
jgi:hypothetical protein